MRICISDPLLTWSGSALFTKTEFPWQSKTGLAIGDFEKLKLAGFVMRFSTNADAFHKHQNT